VTGNRQALVRYRLEQADESLDSARLLLANGKLRPAVSRAYYAMFYAVLALLALRGRAISKHAGAVSLFDAEFVKNGVFDRDLSRWLHEAFDLRQRADYREMFAISQERVASLLGNAEDFVRAVNAHTADQPDDRTEGSASEPA
jgi:uncharacterized protein (UPF0332 family)